jgi:hypothetical protein
VGTRYFFYGLQSQFRNLKEVLPQQQIRNFSKKYRSSTAYLHNRNPNFFQQSTTSSSQLLKGMLPPIAYLHIRNRSCFRKSVTLKRNVAPHLRTSTMECGSADKKKSCRTLDSDIKIRLLHFCNSWLDLNSDLLGSE